MTVVGDFGRQDDTGVGADLIIAGLSQQQRLICAFDAIIGVENRTRVRNDHWNAYSFGAFIACVRSMLRGGFELERTECGIRVRMFVVEPPESPANWITIVPVLTTFFGNDLVVSEAEKTRICQILDLLVPEDQIWPGTRMELEAIAARRYSDWFEFTTATLENKKRALGL